MRFGLNWVLRGVHRQIPLRFHYKLVTIALLMLVGGRGTGAVPLQQG